MLRLLKESNINPVFVAISSETQVTGFYNIIETFQVYTCTCTCMSLCAGVHCCLVYMYMYMYMYMFILQCISDSVGIDADLCLYMYIHCTCTTCDTLVPITQYILKDVFSCMMLYVRTLHTHIVH